MEMLPGFILTKQDAESLYVGNQKRMLTTYELAISEYMMIRAID